MKMSFKNIMIILLVVFLAVMTVLPIFAEKYPPLTDEAYYNTLCSGSIKQEDAERCGEYKKYYQDKITESNKLLKEKTYELNDVKANAAKYEQEYDALKLQVDDLEKQIVTIQSGIKKTEAHIVQLEADIVKQQASIEANEEKVKDYIATSQSQSRTNTFVEFIMGAKDFSDIISRMEGMKRIKEHNDEIIIELNLQKEQIEKDKALAIETVRLMKLDEDILEKKTVELEVRMKEANSLRVTFENMISEIEIAGAKIKEDIKYSQDQISNIGSVVPSGGWFHALGTNKSAYNNNSWGFKYRIPGLSGPHSGADYATYGSRIPVYAPGNGFIVMAAENGCGDGSFSNSCGQAWGNYVTMVVDVQGKIYGVSMAHLTAGSISVKTGDTVKAGQQIARVGTSGSSTGMHLHVEIYDLPYSTLSEGVNAFQSNRDRTFGTAGKPGKVCALGASKPCKVDAPIVWGDRAAGPGYYN